MKKLLILSLVMALGFGGCTEFLKEDVRGVISPNNFYNSDQEAIQATNGLYGIFEGNNLYRGWQGIHNFTLFGADEVIPSRTFGGNAAIVNYTMTETNYSSAYAIWRDLYLIIVSANSVLENVAANPSLSQGVIDQTTGETLFLRALAYYHLTALWGDVPFYTESLTIDEISVLGRTDASLIRNQMIADLARVETENLLRTDIPSSGELGRATRWAATTLKARFMLWEKDWQGAYDASMDIINNSPHILLANYADVFENGNRYNQEVIFGFDFLKDVLSTTRTDSYNPRLRDEPLNSGDRSAFASELSAIGEEFNGYGLCVPLPAVYEDFPDDDLRKPVTLMSEYLGYELKFTYMRKMQNLNFVESPRGNHGETRVVYRLAEVYLMAAEAANELGLNGDALILINTVRERAFDPIQPLSGLGQNDLRIAIQDEKKWELAGESERRYDLIRWGILLDRVQTIDYPNHGSAAANIQPYHVKLPIPAEEIELNTTLLDSDATNNGYR